MARFITRPGPPPKNDETDDFSEQNENVEMDPDPSEFPEEIAYDDDDESPEKTAQMDEEYIEDVCMDWWIYAKPIEVYLCIQPPEKLAWDIFLWERLENIGIDQCTDVHPASPCQPETNIPPGRHHAGTITLRNKCFKGDRDR